MRSMAPSRPAPMTFATEQEETSSRTRAALRAALEELVLPADEMPDAKTDEKLEETVKIPRL